MKILSLEKILNCIDQFNLQIQDLLQLNENNNLMIFKSLLNEQYIEKNEYKGTSYITNVTKVLNELDRNINNGEIGYKDISLFYSENNNKGESLFSRLKIIALNKEEKAKQYFSFIVKNKKVWKIFERNFIYF